MVRKEIRIYSFTKEGSNMQVKLAKVLQENGYICTGYTVERFVRGEQFLAFPKGWKEELGESWGKYALLFIGATGIAVRTIAPYVKDKFSDPPVLVMDEKGKFIIPLLSGHVGGAVALSNLLQEKTGVLSVVTTATDVQNKFAVDVFAKNNQLIITDRNIAKEISASLLEGETVGFWSELAVKGTVPDELQCCNTMEELKHFKRGFVICTEMPEERKDGILYLLSKCLYLGIGCKKGVSKENLLEELEKVLKNLRCVKEQIVRIGSIDLKMHEQGIIDLAKALDTDFVTFSADELKEMGEVRNTSAFVEKITGVDNVCERAAKRLCKDGELVQEKICMHQCTIAVTRKREKIAF